MEPGIEHGRGLVAGRSTRYLSTRDPFPSCLQKKFRTCEPEEKQLIVASSTGRRDAKRSETFFCFFPFPAAGVFLVKAEQRKLPSWTAPTAAEPSNAQQPPPCLADSGSCDSDGYAYVCLVSSLLSRRMLDLCTEY
jgi:hypothetical protein